MTSARSASLSLPHGDVERDLLLLRELREDGALPLAARAGPRGESPPRRASCPGREETLSQSTAMVRPNPRHASHAPTGELYGEETRARPDRTPARTSGTRGHARSACAPSLRRKRGAVDRARPVQRRRSAHSSARPRPRPPKRPRSRVAIVVFRSSRSIRDRPRPRAASPRRRPRSVAPYRCREARRIRGNRRYPSRTRAVTKLEKIVRALGVHGVALTSARDPSHSRTIRLAASSGDAADRGQPAGRARRNRLASEEGPRGTAPDPPSSRGSSDWTSRARAPIDGDRGGDRIQGVDVGTLEPLEELARVGAEALDETPLSFRVERGRLRAMICHDPLGPVSATSWPELERGDRRREGCACAAPVRRTGSTRGGRCGARSPKRKRADGAITGEGVARALRLERNAHAKTRPQGCIHESDRSSVRRDDRRVRKRETEPRSLRRGPSRADRRYAPRSPSRETPVVHRRRSRPSVRRLDRRTRVSGSWALEARWRGWHSRRGRGASGSRKSGVPPVRGGRPGSCRPPTSPRRVRSRRVPRRALRRGENGFSVSRVPSRERHQVVDDGVSETRAPFDLQQDRSARRGILARNGTDVRRDHLKRVAEFMRHLRRDLADGEESLASVVRFAVHSSKLARSGASRVTNPSRVVPGHAPSFGVGSPTTEKTCRLVGVRVPGGLACVWRRGTFNVGTEERVQDPQPARSS